MAEDIHTEMFELPEAFVSAFVSAKSSDARMKVVEQFFDAEALTLGPDDWIALAPNEPYEVYLVGSTALIHIEGRDLDGVLCVVQPVQRRRGTIGKRALESQVVGQLKKGRKLWLLSRRGAARLRKRPPTQESAENQVAAKDEEAASAPTVHPNEIVPETSFVGIPAAKKVESRRKEIDLSAFDQLRTLVQNIRLEFWQGRVRSQPTEAISLASRKAADNDVNGAIQSIEMFENVFARLVEQWEQDFKQAERKARRGGNDGDRNRFKDFQASHVSMHTRISQTKAKFRGVLNWLRDIESKQKREEQAR